MVGNQEIMTSTLVSGNRIVRQVYRLALAEFCAGFPHLTKLIESTSFPWLLSNIVDTNTGRQPEPLKRFIVTERCGVKIGLIGLVEK